METASDTSAVSEEKHPHTLSFARLNIERRLEGAISADGLYTKT